MRPGVDIRPLQTAPVEPIEEEQKGERMGASYLVTVVYQSVVYQQVMKADILFSWSKVRFWLEELTRETMAESGPISHQGPADPEI